MSDYIAELPTTFLYLVSFGFGCLWGSFGNVVILRMPAGKSVVLPRSSCGSCGNMISWFDNIPIISWVLLKGKCRKCSQKISFRYPLVELITGLLFVGAYHYLGISFYLFEIWLFLFSLVVVSFIDFDHYILPDKFTLSGIVIGLICSLVNPIENRDFVDSLLGVFLGGGFLWAIAYFYYVIRKEEGMGGGDIKLLAWIGAVLGWKAVPFVIISSSLLGSLVGLILAIKEKKGMKTVIPFGPYLAIGAVIFIFGGAKIAHWYISFFIPEIQ